MSDKPTKTCKFIFPDLGKFVVMDVQKKIVLEDMKISFAKILSLNLFAKKLSYYFETTPLDHTRTLDYILTMREIAESRDPQLQITIKIEEMGA